MLAKLTASMFMMGRKGRTVVLARSFARRNTGGAKVTMQDMREMTDMESEGGKAPEGESFGQNPTDDGAAQTTTQDNSAEKTVEIKPKVEKANKYAHLGFESNIDEMEMERMYNPKKMVHRADGENHFYGKGQKGGQRSPRGEQEGDVQNSRGKPQRDGRRPEREGGSGERYTGAKHKGKGNPRRTEEGMEDADEELQQIEQVIKERDRNFQKKGQQPKQGLDAEAEEDGAGEAEDGVDEDEFDGLDEDEHHERMDRKGVKSRLPQGDFRRGQPEGGYNPQQNRNQGYNQSRPQYKQNKPYNQREDGDNRRSYDFKSVPRYNDRAGGYNDRSGSYNDRSGGYKDRQGGYNDRQGGYNNNRNRYQDRDRDRDGEEGTRGYSEGKKGNFFNKNNKGFNNNRSFNNRDRDGESNYEDKGKKQIKNEMRSRMDGQARVTLDPRNPQGGQPQDRSTDKPKWVKQPPMGKGPQKSWEVNGAQKTKGDAPASDKPSSGQKHKGDKKKNGDGFDSDFNF